MLKQQTEGQLSLFDTMDEPEPEPTPQEDEDLKQWAFLYTAGRSGDNSGIRFMMTLEDAQTWCSSDLSKGNMHGNPWAYFFTSVWNYCHCHWGQLKGAVLDLQKLVDNGMWDEKIESLGLRKYDKYEIKEILNQYGIEVITRRENVPSVEFVQKHPKEAFDQIFGDEFKK